MLDKSAYVPYGLEPIETASRDEFAALQTERLKWTQLLRCEGLSAHYQIELRRDQRLDVTRLLVEARPGHADEAIRAAQAALLASHIKNSIGVTADVVVNDPGKVKRSLGKARRIIDLGPKE